MTARLRQAARVAVRSWRSAVIRLRVRRAPGSLTFTAMLALPLLTAVLAAAPAMAAEAPRWHITSTSSPTTLAADTPRNEVQTVAVQATGGTFTLTAVSRHCESPQTTAPIPYNASAAEVQSALEGGTPSCVLGAGDVTVTGGPGGSSPYLVTFVGERSNQPIRLMTADRSSLTGGTARVTETARGAFAPYLVITATNVGGVATNGSTITIDDSLSSALTATAISGFDAYGSPFAVNGEGSAAMTCLPLPTLSCSYSGRVDPGDTLRIRMSLSVAEPLAPGINHVTVTGGGTGEAALSAPVASGEAPASFGPVPGSIVAATSTNQAGAHANVTTEFTMSTDEPNHVVADAKDIRFDLPPGLVGSTLRMPQCTMGQVLKVQLEPNACPRDTIVGMATVMLGLGGAGEAEFTLVTPVYNIAPEAGEPAAFGMNAIFLPVRLDTSLLSNGDYGVRVTASGVDEEAATLATSITIWGVPADHNGPGTGGEQTIFGQTFGGANPGQTRVPLLSNPQQCVEPLSATMSADAWSHPGVFFSESAAMGTLTGCDQLSLESSFFMLPDTLEAGAPARYSLDLKVPQSNDPSALAKPNIKNVKLTLPTGTVVNPAVAHGLKTCSDAQFDLHSGMPATCPREAQIGTVEVQTPALPLPLGGELYLAEPQCNPCAPGDVQAGRMVRLFLQVVGEGESPIVVKIEGNGTIDQNTSQITTTFENNPQLPFSDLKVMLNGGSSAPLANPRSCGSVTSNLDLTPWSTPFTPDSTSSYGFEVNQGCFGAQFTPSFVAGTTNIQAGAYTPFTLTFSRAERDQFLSGLKLRMPAGLLGKLSSVTACSEPQAAQGTCGPASLIGHVQALVGAGTTPYLVGGGQVFLTQGYKGAPFGLSIVVPAVAGPYTLAGTTGKGTVVVRTTINIDPTDAHVTITSDPLPTILDGIPLQVKVVNVTIDRNEFTFNPTNCSKLGISGTLSSSEGVSATVSTPFEAANCATLPFKPKFTVLTQGKTSKANGAYLHVKVTSGPGQANIGKVKVDLPKQLPSRLTTLQKACTDVTFKANPTSCPAASVVGAATAVTPVLRSPLTGPAYLVSHAGAAFPDLVIVLQGEGITLDLVGNTDIKQGITISTFNSVPDAPISTFDLVLPEGPHSALAAYGNLCKSRLNMPTAITGQNGAVIKQTTRIAVAGCPKHKHARRAKTHRLRRRAKR
jgi:hypothetical protein